MQNFGKIKTLFNNLLVEGIAKKDASTKKLFKRYLKTIKESEILKTQFLVYNNIETKHMSDGMLANIFISENIKLLEKYNKTDIINENKKLVDLLGKEAEKLDEEHELSGLHESITNLIFTKRTPKNIDVITEEIKNVTNHLHKEKIKETKETIDLPVSILTNVMVEKYNEKYAELNESDKTVLKTLINSNLNDKKKMYTETVGECVDLINKLLQNDYMPTDKLVSVKSKLMEDVDLTEENFIDEYIKIIELKNNLEQHG